MQNPQIETLLAQLAAAEDKLDLLNIVNQENGDRALHLLAEINHIEMKLEILYRNSQS